MKYLTIIKLGGGAITYKDTVLVPRIRKQVVIGLAKELYSYIQSCNGNFLLVHGAGSFGHPLAKKYKLANLKKKNKNKLGAGLTRYRVQKLSAEILSIFLSARLPVYYFSPASLVTHTNGRIASFNTEPIKIALENNLIPVLHGDVVFDKTCQFSICSGDQIISYLSKALAPKKVIFLSDVDGVFTANPKINPRAKLIKIIKKNQIKKLTSQMKQHTNFDVTREMAGKLSEVTQIKGPVYIANGLKKGVLAQALKGQNSGTKII